MFQILNTRENRESQPHTVPGWLRTHSLLQNKHPAAGARKIIGAGAPCAARTRVRVCTRPAISSRPLGAVPRVGVADTAAKLDNPVIIDQLKSEDPTREEDASLIQLVVSRLTDSKTDSMRIGLPFDLAYNIASHAPSLLALRPRRRIV